MGTDKKFFHDKLILLLLSVNAFLAILSSIMLLLKLGNSNSSYHIVQYRSNLGLSAFKNGTSVSLDAFILFVWIVFIVNSILSYKTYHYKKDYAVVVLSLALLLIVLSTIVSNALIVLP